MPEVRARDESEKARFLSVTCVGREVPGVDERRGA